MECDSQSNTLTVQQAIRLRRQATDLLARLIADREQCERRLAEAGKRDPMKFITGRTAIDDAISTARELIDSMDRLLHDFNGHHEDGDTSDAVPHIHTLRYEPKSATRNGKTLGMNGRSDHGERNPFAASTNMRP